jgi:hypothetical protein
MYKQSINTITGELANFIVRLSDNAFIPFDPSNSDYQAYLKWLDGYELQFNLETMSGQWVKTSEGNEPLPADEGTE